MLVSIHHHQALVALWVASNQDSATLLIQDYKPLGSR